MQKSVIQKPLSLNFKENELIKVSPIGEVVGLDGRKFKISGESLVENIQKNALDIVLDENHSFGGAVGWFDKNSFELKSDGIYAKLELNKKGKELIENRVYKYLSPVYDVSGGSVVALDSVGLVNRPNLLNNALNHKGEKVDIKDSNEYKALEKELNEVKALNEAFKKELDELKQSSKADENKDEDDKLELNSRLEKIEKSLDAMSSIFGKKDLEKNEKQTLSDEERKIALMLGLSDDEYKGAK
ncbi:phage protease [Campylobacter corcagiensis]|uniref:Mu-like prophage I protein n=1 Tax=Campylobacter corcagiensis TaxID=1448857 RepID=A0A7M1LFB0_9BACT|nr:phage protease [Campylobacter corcagiensis]QKF64567.1 Mu-like prophage I protein [Campylobacter corcagiensis]QOQ87259.1 hypothetical protein IMC76_08640 [Campylobacter corcagiensis]